jgi:hypothetical protein
MGSYQYRVHGEQSRFNFTLGSDIDGAPWHRAGYTGGVSKIQLKVMDITSSNNSFVIYDICMDKLQIDSENGENGFINKEDLNLANKYENKTVYFDFSNETFSNRETGTGIDLSNIFANDREGKRYSAQIRIITSPFVQTFNLDNNSLWGDISGELRTARKPQKLEMLHFEALEKSQGINSFIKFRTKIDQSLNAFDSNFANAPFDGMNTGTPSPNVDANYDISFLTISFIDSDGNVAQTDNIRELYLTQSTKVDVIDISQSNSSPQNTYTIRTFNNWNPLHTDAEGNLVPAHWKAETLAQKLLVNGQTYKVKLNITNDILFTSDDLSENGFRTLIADARDQDIWKAEMNPKFSDTNYPGFFDNIVIDNEFRDNGRDTRMYFIPTKTFTHLLASNPDIYINKIQLAIKKTMENHLEPRAIESDGTENYQGGGSDKTTTLVLSDATTVDVCWNRIYYIDPNVGNRGVLLGDGKGMLGVDNSSGVVGSDERFKNLIAGPKDENCYFLSVLEKDEIAGGRGTVPDNIRLNSRPSDDFSFPPEANMYHKDATIEKLTGIKPVLFWIQFTDETFHALENHTTNFNSDTKDLSELFPNNNSTDINKGYNIQMKLIQTPQQAGSGNIDVGPKSYSKWQVGIQAPEEDGDRVGNMRGAIVKLRPAMAPVNIHDGSFGIINSTQYRHLGHTSILKFKTTHDVNVKIDTPLNLSARMDLSSAVIPFDGVHPSLKSGASERKSYIKAMRVKFTHDSNASIPITHDFSGTNIIYNTLADASNNSNGIPIDNIIGCEQYYVRVPNLDLSNNKNYNIEIKFLNDKTDDDGNDLSGDFRPADCGFNQDLSGDNIGDKLITSHLPENVIKNFNYYNTDNVFNPHFFNYRFNAKNLRLKFETSGNIYEAPFHKVGSNTGDGSGNIDHVVLHVEDVSNSNTPKYYTIDPATIFIRDTTTSPINAADNLTRDTSYNFTLTDTSLKEITNISNNYNIETAPSYLSTVFVNEKTYKLSLFLLTIPNDEISANWVSEINAGMSSIQENISHQYHLNTAVKLVNNEVIKHNSVYVKSKSQYLKYGIGAEIYFETSGNYADDDGNANKKPWSGIMDDNITHDNVTEIIIHAMQYRTRNPNYGKDTAQPQPPGPPFAVDVSFPEFNKSNGYRTYTFDDLSDPDKIMITRVGGGQLTSLSDISANGKYKITLGENYYDNTDGSLNTNNLDEGSSYQFGITFNTIIGSDSYFYANATNAVSSRTLFINQWQERQEPSYNYLHTADVPKADNISDGSNNIPAVTGDMHLCFSKTATISNADDLRNIFNNTQFKPHGLIHYKDIIKMTHEERQDAYGLVFITPSLNTELFGLSGEPADILQGGSGETIDNIRLHYRGDPVSYRFNRNHETSIPDDIIKLYNNGNVEMGHGSGLYSHTHVGSVNVPASAIIKITNGVGETVGEINEIKSGESYKILFDKIDELKNNTLLNNQYCYQFKIVYHNAIGDSSETSSYLENQTYDAMTCPFFLKTATNPMPELRYYVKDGQFKDPSLNNDVNLGITIQNNKTYRESKGNGHYNLLDKFNKLFVSVSYPNENSNIKVIVPPFGACPSNNPITEILNDNEMPITQLNGIADDSIESISYDFDQIGEGAHNHASFIVTTTNLSQDASGIVLSANDLSGLLIDTKYKISSRIINIVGLSSVDVPLVELGTSGSRTESYFYTRKTPLSVQPRINVRYTDCGYGKILKFDISAQSDINTDISDAAPMGGLDNIKGIWTGGPEYDLSYVHLKASSSDGHDVSINIPIDNIYKDASGEYDILYNNQYNIDLVTFSLRIDPDDYPLWLRSDKTYEISMNMVFESTINKLGATDVRERETITNDPLSIPYETSKKPINISHVFVPFDKQYIINEDRNKDNVADRNRLALSFYTDNNYLWNGGSRWYADASAADNSGATGWNKQTYTASRAFNFKTDLTVSISGGVFNTSNRYDSFKSTNTINDISNNNNDILFVRQDASDSSNNGGFIDLSNSWYTLTMRDLLDGEDFKPAQRMDVGLRLKYIDICGVEISNNDIITQSDSNVSQLTQTTRAMIVPFSLVNKYTFNGDISYDANRRYGLSVGTYTITDIPDDHPLGLFSSSNDITVTTTSNTILSLPGGYYTGDIQINVTGDFGTARVKCKQHLGMEQEMFTYTNVLSAKTSLVPYGESLDGSYNYIYNASRANLKFATGTVGKILTSVPPPNVQITDVSTGTFVTTEPNSNPRCTIKFVNSLDQCGNIIPFDGGSHIDNITFKITRKMFVGVSSEVLTDNEAFKGWGETIILDNFTNSSRSRLEGSYNIIDNIFINDNSSRSYQFIGISYDGIEPSGEVTTARQRAPYNEDKYICGAFKNYSEYSVKLIARNNATGGSDDASGDSSGNMTTKVPTTMSGISFTQDDNKEGIQGSFNNTDLSYILQFGLYDDDLETLSDNKRGQRYYTNPTLVGNTADYVVIKDASMGVYYTQNDNLSFKNESISSKLDNSRWIPHWYDEDNINKLQPMDTALIRVRSAMANSFTKQYIDDASFAIVINRKFMPDDPETYYSKYITWDNIEGNVFLRDNGIWSISGENYASRNLVSSNNGSIGVVQNYVTFDDSPLCVLAVEATNKCEELSYNIKINGDASVTDNGGLEDLFKKTYRPHTIEIQARQGVDVPDLMGSYYQTDGKLTDSAFDASSANYSHIEEWDNNLFTTVKTYYLDVSGNVYDSSDNISYGKGNGTPVASLPDSDWGENKELTISGLFNPNYPFEKTINLLNENNEGYKFIAKKSVPGLYDNLMFSKSYYPFVGVPLQFKLKMKFGNWGHVDVNGDYSLWDIDTIETPTLNTTNTNNNMNKKYSIVDRYVRYVHQPITPHFDGGGDNQKLICSSGNYIMCKGVMPYLSDLSNIAIDSSWCNQIIPIVYNGGVQPSEDSAHSEHDINDAEYMFNCITLYSKRSDNFNLENKKTYDADWKSETISIEDVCGNTGINDGSQKIQIGGQPFLVAQQRNQRDQISFDQEGLGGVQSLIIVLENAHGNRVYTFSPGGLAVMAKLNGVNPINRMGYINIDDNITTLNYLTNSAMPTDISFADGILDNVSTTTLIKNMDIVVEPRVYFNTDLVDASTSKIEIDVKPWSSDEDERNYRSSLDFSNVLVIPSNKKYNISDYNLISNSYTRIYNYGDLSLNSVNKDNQIQHILNTGTFIYVQDGDISGAKIFQINSAGVKTESGITDKNGRLLLTLNSDTVEILAEGGIDVDLDNQPSEFRLKMRVTPETAFGTRYITPLTTILADVSENEMSDVLGKLDLQINNDELTKKNPKEDANIDIKRKQSKIATLIKFFKYSYLRGNAYVDNDHDGSKVMKAFANSITTLEHNKKIFDDDGKTTDDFINNTRDKMKQESSNSQVQSSFLDGGENDDENSKFRKSLNSINNNFKQRNIAQTTSVVDSEQRKTEGRGKLMTAIKNHLN